MSIQINVADAKARLSELLARAERGEQITLARAGRPITTLSPWKMHQNASSASTLNSRSHATSSWLR